ncbi:LysR family transcriptional regulator [Sporosarcina sp. Marseille-Q4943]|uniref:LysR family transcriptional regulator n=1 Tax=Sporosarcina sp. Marseille-Q4943 TaxID=2942204 RepID=UPI00208DC3C3|nr:LysR family transcriptional regulator [Sporosarcina sp. Marseille-Q4943]
MEDYDWLVLQVLFEHKNITKTAQELFVSQPSITKRLHRIEIEFGVTIARRGRRGVHFTPQGEFLAKSANDILSSIQNIRDGLKSMGNQTTETLRIGLSNYSTKYKLPHILKKFKVENPNVEYQVITGSTQEIYNLVYNREVHIAFVRGNYNWPGQRHLLFEEPICIASIGDINVENLPDLSRIDYQKENNFKAVLDSWWTENYSKPPLIGMKVDNVDTCREMLINGLGYAIVPKLILANDKNLKKINIKDKEGKTILRETWMFYYNETLEKNIVQAFVNFIKGLDL